MFLVLNMILMLNIVLEGWLSAWNEICLRQVRNLDHIPCYEVSISTFHGRTITGPKAQLTKGK